MKEKGYWKMQKKWPKWHIVYPLKVKHIKKGMILIFHN